MHEFFNNVVENPLSGVTLIESVNIFIQVSMQMLLRAFMMDPPKPVLELHDLSMQLFQSFTIPGLYLLYWHFLFEFLIRSVLILASLLTIAFKANLRVSA